MPVLRKLIDGFKDEVWKASMRRMIMKLMIATALIVAMTMPAYSSFFYSISHVDFKGYEIENKTKMLISPFYDKDNSIQPGETRKISNSEKQYLFRWSVTSSKEAFLFDECYYIMLDSDNNKLTINGSNTFRNAFPWSIKKIKDNADLVLNISANCGEEVYYSYDEFSFKSSKIPSRIIIPKDKIDYLVKVFVKFEAKVYSAKLLVPFAFKGGEYELRFELWQDSRTTVNMINDEKKTLKLEGCECLQVYSMVVTRLINISIMHLA